MECTVCHTPLTTYHQPLKSFIFRPAFDSDIVYRHGTESIDKRTCQTSIGNQGHIQVDSGTTDLISIVQLPAVRFFGILTTMSIFSDATYPVPEVSLPHWANTRGYFSTPFSVRKWDEPPVA